MRQFGTDNCWSRVDRLDRARGNAKDESKRDGIRAICSDSACLCNVCKGIVLTKVSDESRSCTVTGARLKVTDEKSRGLMGFVCEERGPLAPFFSVVFFFLIETSDLVRVFVSFTGLFFSYL